MRARSPLRFLIGAAALAAFVAIPARAEPPPAPDIPACDAPSGAESVARQYRTMRMEPYAPGELKIGPVTDHGVFPPRPNPYETKEMFVKAVRYCEAAVTLPDGTEDRAYWAIPLTFNVRSWLTMATYCSLKSDVFETQCARVRPEGAVRPRN